MRLVRMNGVPSFDSKRQPGTSASNCTITGSLQCISAARIAASIATEQSDFMMTSMFKHVVFPNRCFHPRRAARTCSQNESWSLKARFFVPIMNGERATQWIGMPRATNKGLPRRQRDMLRLGQHVRLTSKEVEHLTHLTGFAPEGIKRLDDLRSYIRRCKRHYWGTSSDTRELHRMIDDAFARCVGVDRD